MAERTRLLLVSATDSTLGAGLAADLRACDAFDADARAAVTAVTAQGGVADGVFAVSPAALAAQLAAAGAVDGVKVGVIPDRGLVVELRDWLEARPAAQRPLPVVVDPVQAASSGQPLAGEGAWEAVRDRLLPLATLATPNRGECERLLGRALPSIDAVAAAADALRALGCPVLVTGGHFDGADRCVDLLVTADEVVPFEHPRRRLRAARGTGCWLATAIAVGLARGRTLREAVGEGIDAHQAALTSVEAGAGIA